MVWYVWHVFLSEDRIRTTSATRDIVQMEFKLNKQTRDPRFGCTDSSVAKDRLSDAGGPRFESQTGQITGKPSPAIKGLRPPEHHAGQLYQIKRLLRVKTKFRTSEGLMQA